jgi:hypothetical protein
LLYVVPDTLSRDEEERIRAEVRARLEDLEAQRQRRAGRDEDGRRREELERERERRRIIREEEERFFRERGYRRFVDRAGNVRWLSPDQVEKRNIEIERRRRRSRTKRIQRAVERLNLKVIGLATGALVVTALVLYFIFSYKRF